MVRLRAAFVQSVEQKMVIFQFQNGTIMRHFCFIQIRCLPLISIPKWYDYEPNSVLLIVPIEVYFNSKMVRLWDFHPIKLATSLLISIPKWYDYEFRNGNLDRFKSGISIPKWYDYENRTRKNWGVKNGFQFQNGTIMSSSGCQSSSFVTKISIPKWYDYEPNKPYLKPVSKFHFNSKMVRLRDPLNWVLLWKFLISIPKWYD